MDRLAKRKISAGSIKANKTDKEPEKRDLDKTLIFAKTLLALGSEKMYDVRKPLSDFHYLCNDPANRAILVMCRDRIMGSKCFCLTH